MSKNSFEELAQKNEAKFEASSQEIRKNIEQRKDIWSLLAELIELYIPKLLQTLTNNNVTSGSNMAENDVHK